MMKTKSNSNFSSANHKTQESLKNTSIIVNRFLNDRALDENKRSRDNKLSEYQFLCGNKSLKNHSTTFSSRPTTSMNKSALIHCLNLPGPLMS